MEAKAEELQQKIKDQYRLITAAETEVRKIAGEGIPEFNFLQHQVSDFWPCAESPIGWCVWDVSERGFHIDVMCHYCGDPVERK